MIILNKTPEQMSKETLDELKKSGMVVYRDRLTKIDLCRLVEAVKISENISPEDKSCICRCNNVYRSKRK